MENKLEADLEQAMQSAGYELMPHAVRWAFREGWEAARQSPGVQPQKEKSDG